MVVPKRSIDSEKHNSDGDKSPSPEPFREPEDLVSIDLHIGKKHRKSSDTPYGKEVDYKKKVFKILLLVFIFNIIILVVFAVMVYLNEERYLFKTKPLSTPTFNDAKIPEESEDPLTDMILRCLDQNSLSVCCDFFKNAETSFGLDEWCELDHMISSMDIDIRRKRELGNEILRKKRTNMFTDSVKYDVPRDVYTENIDQNQPAYYNYDYGDQNRNIDYGNYMETNNFIDYGNENVPLNYQEYPLELENHHDSLNEQSFPFPITRVDEFQQQDEKLIVPGNHGGLIPENFRGIANEGFKEIHEERKTMNYDSVNNQEITHKGKSTTTEDVPYSVTLSLNFPEDQLSDITTVSPTEIIHVENSNPIEELKSYSSTDPTQIYSIEDSSLLDRPSESDINSQQTIIDAAEKTISQSLETVRDHEESLQNTTPIPSDVDASKDDHNEELTESMNESEILNSLRNGEVKESSDKHRANEAEDNRPKTKSEFFPSTMDMQSNPQAMFNPCMNPYPNTFYNPFRMTQPSLAFDSNQLMKIIPSNNQKATPFVLNPPMYPYMQSSYIPNPQYVMPSFWQQNLQQSHSSNPIQVSGPGGQFYVCNPIPPVTNNIASVSGIEVRRESSNLQDMLTGISEQFKMSNKSRESLIVCPVGQQSCDDGSKCIPKHHVCDNEAHCEDGSDEMLCTCKDRVGKLRTCDGYFDCPDGQDELGCFGCGKDEFSCDDWSRFRKSTCIPIEHRCDGIRQCEITGKDEEDCSVLADNVGNQPQYKISNSVGFLHRNYKGKWYPTCFGTDLWATEVCQTESGPTSIIPKSHMMLTTDKYDGNFINILPNDNINLVKNCVQDRAAFVECPPLFCGLRMTIKNPYRPQEVDTSIENVINDLERGAESKRENLVLGNPRVVGGKASQPAAWPWLVSIYKNGIFHCGGVLINEMWIVTAAHCVDKFWLYYYEIQAGMLRRFSYAPMEQHRWASAIIANENYDKSTLGNDIALMKLSSPVRFNRYVRPICLPSEATAGRDFMNGPLPGTICTTVGWGATVEHGSDPDHMREVEIPILSRCKNPDDKGGDELCAGLSEGGRDACQGDSGGPLMCRNPNNPSQWYLAGIVSHGEGCARPDEPGVYTKVSKYVGWIAENVGSGRFFSNLPLQSCPGYICKFTNQCLPKKHHCDRIVDCLFGDDETNCKHTFHSIFKHSRKNHLLRKVQNETEKRRIGKTSEDSQTVAMANKNLLHEVLDIFSGGLTEKSEISTTSESSTTEEAQDIMNNNDIEDIYQTSIPIAEVVTPHEREMRINITEDLNDPHENKSFQKIHFTCNSLLQIIPADKKCDKVIDCEDGTDEDNCSCADYIRTTNPAAVCDGITDCFDGTDEVNCSTCDSTSEYHCRQSKQCINSKKRCDGVTDCLKKEDEWDCAALTDGETLTLDSDLRPELAMSGIITINRFGVWRPFCSNVSDNEASIVTNVCNLLGFEEYVDYHKYLVADRPINVIQKNASEHQVTPKIDGDTMKDKQRISNVSTQCSGLNVRCSMVSLDKSVHSIRPDNVTGDVELYTSPWNAVIYSNGGYRCMGTILDPRWIITSVNCFKGITSLKKHYITVLLGIGKAQLQVRGPHEQIFRIVEKIDVPKSDITLLGTDRNITYTRYVKNAVLDLRRDGRRKERCIAIGLHRDNAKYVLLTPIEFCYVGSRCFESNVINDCKDSVPWSGTIVCDSSNGWYPAAVYHEASGPCGLTAVKQFTSIPFYKKHILNILQRVPTPVEAPPCDGFRCALGKCIYENKTCDGLPDCRNGDDETLNSCQNKDMSCHLGNGSCECPLTHLKCNNSKCVTKSSFCDSVNDCGDNSDEPSTCSCRAYLQLTNPEKVCDGILHCQDRSDEDPMLCACRMDAFNCLSVDVCVSNDMICDGINDCPNGEDEKVCYDLSSTRGRRSNAGEVMTQTGGKWHRGCFDTANNTTELNKICEKLGFFNSTSIQLKPPQDIDNMNTPRPVIDHFDSIWIHNNQSDAFAIGIRKGNRPYVNFVPDDHCYRLFVACL